MRVKERELWSLMEIISRKLYQKQQPPCTYQNVWSGSPYRDASLQVGPGHPLELLIQTTEICSSGQNGCLGGWILWHCTSVRSLSFPDPPSNFQAFPKLDLVTLLSYLPLVVRGDFTIPPPCHLIEVCQRLLHRQCSIKRGAVQKCASALTNQG